MCFQGDIICVFLGYDAPVILRPWRRTPTASYELVGDAFVYGLHDGTAFLGELPSPWRVRVFEDDAGYLTSYRFFNPESNLLTDQDPRLGSLEEPWTRIPNPPRTASDPVLLQCFKHNETGEIVKYDPRMHPEALMTRGLVLDTFCLV